MGGDGLMRLLVRRRGGAFGTKGLSWRCEGPRRLHEKGEAWCEWAGCESPRGPHRVPGSD